jgi:rare lipoprotein A
LIFFAAILLPAALLGRGPGLPGDSVVPKEKHRPATAKVEHGPIKTQYGIASFYSNKFEGRKTYTDEIFTQDSLTGASNTLPMHVWVKVTNLRNNRTVFVRINDKMHPSNKRIIDLSHAAAVKLGYAGRGLTRVRIDVIGRKKPPEAEDETADRRQGQD